MAAPRSPQGDFGKQIAQMERRLNSLDRKKSTGLVSLELGNRDVPNPPTNVEYEGIDVNGTPAVRTTWLPPTTNTDGTPLVDLWGYQIQQQIGLTVSWDDPDMVAPAKADQSLNRLMDRSSMGDGWTGGDGGASHRDAGGMDWWFWSDSTWGSLNSKGEVEKWFMLRNSITSTLGKDPKSMRMFTGHENWFTDARMAAGQWGGNGGTRLAIADGIRWTPGAAGQYLTPVVAGRMPVVAGQGVSLSARLSVPGTNLRLQWQTAAGGNLPGSQYVQALAVADDEITSVQGTAPVGAERATVVILAASTAPVDIFQLYLAAGPARMASWRRATEDYQFTNLAFNPEGSGKAVSTSTVEMWRNLALNPSHEGPTSTENLYNGATKALTASATAWVGSKVLRVNKGTAGTGSIIMFDYNVPVGRVSPGDNVKYRLRIRRGSLANPASALVGMFYFFNGSDRVSPDGAYVTANLNAEWTEYTFTGTVPATANKAALILGTSGPAWSAADWFEVDGRELYKGATLPDTYFDGSTPDRPGWAFSWAGAAHDSDSIMLATTVQRRNLALNPTVTGLSGWTGGNGATVRLDGSSTPSGGTGVLLPAVTNPGALTALRSRLASPNVIAGIGVNGDSTAETTGSLSNDDLSDRWGDILQRELRRVHQSPGVRIDPEGYYGTSAYVSARYQHPGPIDWEVRGPSSDISHVGTSGRAVSLPYGSSVHGRAVFDSAILEMVKGGFGRIAVVSIDGVEVARINLFGTEGELVQFDTGPLGYGEHLISVQSSRVAGLVDGDIRVCGAQLFDEVNRTRGTRVYDLSCSGRALDDHIQHPEILTANLKRPLDLMVWSLDFNDAGRGITPAQHKANLLTVLQRQRARGYTGKNLIVAKWTPSTTVTSQWPASMDAYRQAMREVALEQSDTAFIDLGEVMPSVDEDNSLYDDSLHPNEIGHQRIAAVMRGVILGQSSTNSVLVSTDASGEAAVFTGWAAGTFDNRKVFTWSGKVQGPAGRKVRARVKVPGMADDLSGDLTFTGGWDDLAVTAEVSMAATSTTPAVWVEQADSGGAMQWRVSEILTEEGLLAGEFFYSGTPDSEVLDYGSLGNGQSVARTYSPILWSSTQGALSFDPTVKHDFTGSVKFVPAYANASFDVMFGGTAALTGAHTVAFWMLSEVADAVAAVALWKNTSTGVVSQGPAIASKPLTADKWTEARATVTPPAGSQLVGMRVASSAGNPLWSTEITVVAGAYTGPTFSGGSKGQHAKSVWTGIAGLSTSVLTMSNTSFASDPLQHTTLISAESAGLEGWKFLWCQGAIGDGDTAVMFLQSFYHRPMFEESGFNFEWSGDIVVAKFDLATERLLDVYVIDDGSTTQWGEALWIEGDTLYCYGSDARAEDTGRVMLRTWPKAAIHGDLLLSDSSVWNGTAWAPGTSTPGPVATLPIVGGFSAVRKLGEKWVALFTAGFMDHLQSWEAAGPQGPFVPTDVVYPYPSDGVHRYVPRFHPQFDSGEFGVSMSICESGAGRYRPHFLLGRPGTRVAGFGDEYWGETRWAATAEHIEMDVPPGTPYRVRIRAVDTMGNSSEWAVGAEAFPGGEQPAVPRPSTPIVSSFFRGGRVFYDGLDENGEAYEGFRHYEVHLNKGGQDFDPNNWTRVDSSVVEGGVTPVSVEDYLTYYVGIVVVTAAGKSQMSPTVAFQPERLSDPDLANTLIDGARLKPGTVNASALTVGSFTDNLLPNANFEQASLADGTKPSMWTAGWARGDRDWGTAPWESAGTWERSEDNPIAGSASLRLTTTADTWRQVLSDPPIPVQPGDIYYAAARVRTDGIDGEIEVRLLLGETEADVNGFGSPSGASILVGTTAGGQSTQLVEGPIEVPDLHGDGTGNAMRFAAVAIEAKATGRAYTTWVDNVDFKRIVGEAAIADASINRAKIRYLAVDDARIANVGVGKLVTGELFADITVSARIMTAKTGKRWEANPNGAYTFNPDLTGGNDQIPVTEMRSTDGGLVSRWFRTNTTGTRIEMGTYGIGADSALISFHSTTRWQFPPAFGFGGGDRQGGVPGLAIHAGSFNEAYYEKYGMNMLAVDQTGGVHMGTGTLLSGLPATHGAPIVINAGGEDAFIDMKSGSSMNWSDPARLRLDPQKGQSLLALNYGSIQFVEAGGSASDHYQIRFVSGEDWLGVNQLLIRTGYGVLRVQTGDNPNAMILRGTQLSVQGDVESGGAFKRPFGAAARLMTRNSTTVEFDRYGNPWTNQGTARASNAFWANAAGNMEGNGSWNVPRIKVRGQDSYISWDDSGSAYLNGSNSPLPKTFVIDHPLEEDRLLVHAVVEGPTADVFYRGEGRLEDGSATVALPDYFEALTVAGSATVQVTAIYEPGLGTPMVAASRVRDGRFTVAGLGADGWGSFFWEVKAERARTGFDVEPVRSDVEVVGDGPYRYIKP